MESAHRLEETAEGGVRMMDAAYRSHRLKPYRNAAHAEAAADKANIHALQKSRPSDRIRSFPVTPIPGGSRNGLSKGIYGGKSRQGRDEYRPDNTENSQIR